MPSFNALHFLMEKKRARISTFVFFTKLSDGIKKNTFHRNPVNFYVREIKNKFFKMQFCKLLFVCLVLHRLRCESPDPNQQYL